MSYKKILKTKIIRTTHRVTIRAGLKANEIAADLASVPSHAKLIDIKGLIDDGQGVYLDFEIDETEILPT